MPLFELAPFVWPAWYTPGRGRPTSNQRVARGQHPNGLRLHVPAVAAEHGPTCGDCAWFVQKRHNARNYGKCPRTMGTGASTASDVVRRWAACERFRWVHLAVATQTAIPGVDEARLTACGQLVPPAEADDRRERDNQVVRVTCPACLLEAGR